MGVWAGEGWLEARWCSGFPPVTRVWRTVLGPGFDPGLECLLVWFNAKLHLHGGLILYMVGRISSCSCFCHYFCPLCFCIVRLGQTLAVGAFLHYITGVVLFFTLLSWSFFLFLFSSSFFVFTLHYWRSPFFLLLFFLLFIYMFYIIGVVLDQFMHFILLNVLRF